MMSHFPVMYCIEGHTDVPGAMISNGYLHIADPNDTTTLQEVNSIGASGVTTVAVKLMDHLKLNVDHHDATAGGVSQQRSSVRKVDGDQSETDWLKCTTSDTTKPVGRGGMWVRGNGNVWESSTS